MEKWQNTRLCRAKKQDIYIYHVHSQEDSFIFVAQGLSDLYTVDVCQDIEMWPPRCDCEDNYWRPDLLCKYIILCLRLMGVEEELLEDCCWEPEQRELYESLCNAPECVGGCLLPDRSRE